MTKYRIVTVFSKDCYFKSMGTDAYLYARETLGEHWSDKLDQKQVSERDGRYYIHDGKDDFEVMKEWLTTKVIFDE